MKKVLFTLLSASLMLAATGCNQKDDMLVEFPAPATKEQAVSLEFNQGEILHLELPARNLSGDSKDVKTTGETTSVKISSIDMSENNRYTLYIDGKNTKVPDKTPILIWTGHYIYNFETKEYEMDGFGKLSLKEKGCRIQPLLSKASYGDPQEIAATIIKIITGSTAASNLARNWTVVSTQLTVEGGSDNINISRNFDGCDFKEMALYCKSKRVNLTDEDIARLEGFKVSNISIQGNNTLIIGFDDAQPFYGSYTLNGNNFTWELNDSNKLLSASATGSYSFTLNGHIKLSMTTSVSAKSETYSGTLGFDLAQVAN